MEDARPGVVQADDLVLAVQHGHRHVGVGGQRDLVEGHAGVEHGPDGFVRVQTGDAPRSLAEVGAEVQRAAHPGELHRVRDHLGRSPIHVRRHDLANREADGVEELEERLEPAAVSARVAVHDGGLAADIPAASLTSPASCARAGRERFG